MDCPPCPRVFHAAPRAIAYLRYVLHPLVAGLPCCRWVRRLLAAGLPCRRLVRHFPPSLVECLRSACLCHTCRCGSACCGSPGRPPRDVRFSQAPARLKWWVCCVSSCPSAFVEAYCGASMLFKHPRHLVGVTNDENTILIGDPRHVPLCVPSGLLVPPSGNDRRGVACTFHSLPSSPSHCSHRLPPRWLRFFWESICPWPPVQRAGAAPPLYGTTSFALLVSLLAFVALLGLLLAAVVVAARRGVCKGRLSRGFCGSQPWQTPPP